MIFLFSFFPFSSFSSFASLFTPFLPPPSHILYSYHSSPTLFSPLTRTYSANAAVIAEDELLCGTYLTVVCPYVRVLSSVTTSRLVSLLKFCQLFLSSFIFIFLRACHPLLTFAFTCLAPFPSPYLLSLCLPPPLFPSPSLSLPTYSTSASSINAKHAQTSPTD